MNLSVRLQAETVRTLAFGGIGAGFLPIGTAITHATPLCFVQNLTDVTLMFSLDGTNEHFPLSANGYLVLDVQSNKSKSQALSIAKGTIFYVRRVGVPTVGSVYVTTFYGAE